MSRCRARRKPCARRRANNHNLANASTTGFKADLTAFQSRAVTGPGFRLAGLRDRFVRRLGPSPAARRRPPATRSTSRSTDRDSSPCRTATATRPIHARGDLHVDPSGQLMTATGHAGAGRWRDRSPCRRPPPSPSAATAPCRIVPLGQTPLTTSNVGRIKLVNPPSDTVAARRGRPVPHAASGAPAEADAHDHSHLRACSKSSNVEPRQLAWST